MPFRRRLKCGWLNGVGRSNCDLPKGMFSGNQVRRMKKVHIIFVCLILGFSVFGKLAAAPDDLLASYHFVGSAALAGNPNAAKLRKIWALPETAQLSGDVLQKLARASAKSFGTDSGTNRATVLRPLFDDLLSAESSAELHGKPNSSLELYLAVHLDDTRSKIWETNLLQAGKGTQPQFAKLGEITGWQDKLNGSPNFLKFFRAGQWTVIFLAAEQAPAQLEFLNRIKKSDRPGTDQAWLEANVDWPRLQPWFPLDFLPLKPARTELKISGRGGEDLRTVVRVIYPDKIDWKGEAWKIPTNSIRDPLISFIAGQKLAPFFKPWKTIQQLTFNPLANQIYFWAQSQMPFQSYVGIPVKDATNTMKTLGPQLAGAFNDTLKQRGGGTLNVATNHVDLFWQGVPIIVPFLGPSKEKNSSGLLLGGTFPLVANTNLPPAELFGQVSGRSDLVFYDWEITESRLSQWQILSQLLPFFSREIVSATNAIAPKRFVAAKVPEQKWLSKVGPLLGNTITEVTYKSPNELTIVRKSHIGMNSLELILFSHWLAHPGFPSINPFATVPSVEPSVKPPAKSAAKP